MHLGMLASLIAAVPVAAHQSAAPSGNVVVNGVRDVVVNGRARICRPLPGDPQDKVVVSPRGDEKPRESEVARLADGRYFFQSPDAEHMTGPDAWARAGVGIDQYVFRAPTDGRPLCIGGRSPDGGTWGQLRRLVDAAPYWGKRVRFTAWVATGQARLVSFWLVAGHKTQVAYAGGNTNNRPWGGDHGWTPVALETGPIDRKADHLSYGFLLHGAGAVWAYKPQLEIVTDAAGLARKGNVLMIGSSGREPAGPTPADGMGPG